MVLKVANVNSNQQTARPENKATASDNYISINFVKDYKDDKSNKAQVAKENLEAEIIAELDLEDNFLKPTIIEKDGEHFLRLSRDHKDKNRSRQKHSFSMLAIKQKLGIKDGVLTNNNDIGDVTQRLLYKNSDSAVIEAGKSLIIPLSELGQTSRYRFFSIFSSHDLRDTVKAYYEALK